MSIIPSGSTDISLCILVIKKKDKKEKAIVWTLPFSYATLITAN